MTEAIDLTASAERAGDGARANPKSKSRTKRPAKPKPALTSGAEMVLSDAQKARAGKTGPKAKPAQTAETKASIVLKRLKSSKGVAIDTLMDATGWQAHSVRGFLSAVVKKKLGLSLVSEVGKDGVRRYRIENADKAK